MLYLLFLCIRKNIFATLLCIFETTIAVKQKQNILLTLKFYRDFDLRLQYDKYNKHNHSIQSNEFSPSFASGLNLTMYKALFYFTWLLCWSK